MQLSNKEIPDSSLRSVEINKKQTLHQNLLKKNNNAMPSGSSATEDLQTIFVPNESHQQKYTQCRLSANHYKGTKMGHCAEYEKIISSPEENGKIGNPGTFNNFQKVVEYKKTTGNISTTRLSPKKMKRKSVSTEFRNFRHKAAEQSQVLVKKEIPVEESSLENRLIESVLSPEKSEENLDTKIIPFYQQRGKRTKKEVKSFVSLSYGSKETDYSRGTVEKNITSGDEVCEDDQVMVHIDEAVFSPEKVWKGDKDENIHSVEISEKVCNQAKSDSLFSGKSNSEFITHSESSNQSQENCDSINLQRNPINVEIVAKIPSDEYLQSILHAENMLFLYVSFRVENITINSTKLKITKEYLEAIISDEKKMESLKKKMFTFLPSEYKNREMLMELAIHESVFERSRTTPIESPKQNHPTTTEKEYSNQDIQTNARNIRKLHNNQAVNTAVTHYKVDNNDGEILCPENICERVSHQVTSDSSLVNNKQTTSIPVSEENCDMIKVEISARMPRKKHHKTTFRRESMAILQINFLIKNDLIHSTKFKIEEKDLEVIHSDETKLEGLKKKFYSFLSPKYKNHEMFICLTNHDMVFDK